MRPAGTVKRGCGAPGSVQPVKATPKDRVRSFRILGQDIQLRAVQAGNEQIAHLRRGLPAR